MNKKIKQTAISAECKKGLLVINDTLELLAGKWKIKIVAVLLKSGKFNFMELLRETDGIGSKMLSRNLQELEANHLLTRTVKDTKPITVEYELTTHGRSLSKVIDEIEDWGTSHRKIVLSAVSKS